jgi:hypothetical protein
MTHLEPPSFLISWCRRLFDRALFDEFAYIDGPKRLIADSLTLRISDVVNSPEATPIAY